MFGHDDNSKQDDNTSVSPTDQPQVTALPPEPIAPAASSSTPSFIATDDKGQPDESVSAPSVPAAAGDLFDIEVIVGQAYQADV